MKFLKWLENGTNNLGLWDVAFLKWSTLVFGIFLSKLFPILMKINIWVYLILAFALWLKPGYAFLFKEREKK